MTVFRCELIRETLHVYFALHFKHDFLDVCIEDILDFRWEFPRLRFSYFYGFFMFKVHHNATTIIVIAAILSNYNCFSIGTID